MNTAELTGTQVGTLLPLLPQPFPARLKTLLAAMLAAPLALAVLAGAAASQAARPVMEAVARSDGLPLLPQPLGSHLRHVLAVIVGAPIVVVLALLPFSLVVAAGALGFIAWRRRAPAQRPDAGRVLPHGMAAFDARMFRFDPTCDDVLARDAA